MSGRYSARASLYSNSSYGTLGRGSSYADTGGRRGRRDYSADSAARSSYRCTSADLCTPKTPTLGIRVLDYSVPKIRVRDRSTDLSLTGSTRSRDFSINEIERMRTRPRIVGGDEDERSQEYRNILAKAENITDKDIIKDLDMSKTEKSDIINNSDLSTKTFNVIRIDKSNNKEKKNYSWRKEMKGYEDELERLNARSESRTRENSYRDKMIKLEDTIIRPKLNSDVGSRNIKIEIKPTYSVDNKENMNMNNVQQKYSSGNKSVYEMNRMNAVNTYEEPKSPKKGSWRKDIARYEEDLELKKIHKETQRKMDSYNTN